MKTFPIMSQQVSLQCLIFHSLLQGYQFNTFVNPKLQYRIGFWDTSSVVLNVALHGSGS